MHEEERSRRAVPASPAGQMAAAISPDALLAEQTLLGMVHRKNELLIALADELRKLRDIASRTQDQVARMQIELAELREREEGKPGKPSRTESNDGS